MLKINKKGQASSTFQLLIAAIVALAILGVLMSVLNIMPGMNTEPESATRTRLKSQIDSPGREDCTTRVTFNRSQSRLVTESLINETGLDYSQVYFDNPEGLSQFTTKSGEDVDNQMLEYKPSNTYRVIMCVICSNSINNLERAITLNKKESDNFESVKDIKGLEDDQTLCVVYPRKTG